jgi:hypothetical protein
MLSKMCIYLPPSPKPLILNLRQAHIGKLWQHRVYTAKDKVEKSAGQVGRFVVVTDDGRVKTEVGYEEENGNDEERQAHHWVGEPEV